MTTNHFPAPDRLPAAIAGPVNTTPWEECPRSDFQLAQRKDPLMATAAPPTRHFSASPFRRSAWTNGTPWWVLDGAQQDAQREADAATPYYVSTAGEQQWRVTGEPVRRPYQPPADVDDVIYLPRHPELGDFLAQARGEGYR